MDVAVVAAVAVKILGDLATIHIEPYPIAIMPLNDTVLLSAIIVWFSFSPIGVVT